MLTIRMPRRRGTGAVRAFARVLSTLFVAAVLAGLPQLLLVAPAMAAEQPTALTNVRLWVYPEYDDPRLLLMLEGNVPAGTKIPATVRFLVPAGAEMYSAGSMDAQGNYKGGPPNRKPSDVAGWDEISYDLTTNTFRVEYYTDSIRGLPDKTIDYEFRTLYPIDSLQVEILQPAKASNFNAIPAPQSRGSVQQMVTHNYRYTNVSITEPLKFGLSYTKADSIPSVTPQGTPTQAANPNMVWLLGIAGAAVIAGGAIWYSGNRRRYRPAPYRGARGASRSPASARSAPLRTPVSQASSQRGARAERTPQKAAGGATFCRKCGTKIEGSARFCNRCGTRV